MLHRAANPATVANPDLSEKQDPDPHQSEKQDPDPQLSEKQDPDPQLNEKQDPDPHRCDAESATLNLTRQGRSLFPKILFLLFQCTKLAVYVRNTCNWFRHKVQHHHHQQHQTQP